MSPKSKRALKAAIRLLLEQGHPAKWIARELGVGRDVIYRAAPLFFAQSRRKRATTA